MRAVALFLALLACGGGSTDTGGRDSDSGDSDSGDSDPEPVPVEDLGEFCPMGCNLETCVDDESADCDSSLCLYDGRFGLDTYCTQPCEGSCPAGYSCLAAADGFGDVCMANRAVCGNGVQERGEACDDGNTEDRDFCSGDCKMVTVPPSGGSFSFGDQGFPLIELEGDEPRVFAYRKVLGDGKVNLSVGTNQGDYFALDLADVEGAAPPTTVYTDITALFGVCNFRGSGRVTQLSRYDKEKRQAAGTFTSEITCTANCFDCGGDGKRRTFEGAFDVTWRDAE
jgi:cysteine-rich repeat protein